MIQFPLGPDQRHIMSIVLTTDDGTWGDHLIIKLDDIPYATIPIVDKKGLKRTIDGLKNLYRNYGKT